MAKFRNKSMKQQAEAFVQARTQLGTEKNQFSISSIRTANEYQRILGNAAQAIQEEHKISQLKNITFTMAMEHLEQRAELIGQNALDNERRALQLLNQKGYALENHKLQRMQADGGHTKYPGNRAYSNNQIQTIAKHQLKHNALATRIAYAAGLRQHELFTIRKASEQPQSGHRKWHQDRFIGREGQIYTVKGKGGLIREVIIPKSLANQLEHLKRIDPLHQSDRGVFYQKQYDIGAGQAWAKSFREAAKRGYGSHKGAHGVRHSYAQQRMVELRIKGLPYKESLAIVSQELGHFRPEITKIYLR